MVVTSARMTEAKIMIPPPWTGDLLGYAYMAMAPEMRPKKVPEVPASLQHDGAARRSAAQRGAAQRGARFCSQCPV